MKWTPYKSHLYREYQKELVILNRKIQYIEDFDGLYNKEFWEKRSVRPFDYYGKVITQLFKIKDMVDFGCGIGSYLIGALQGGAEAVLGFEKGYEAGKEYFPKEIAEHIQYGDMGELIDCGKWDCVLSIEVAEHLLPGEVSIYLENLINASKRLIIMSTSPKRSMYHFNPQYREYWIEKFEECGIEYSGMKTLRLINAFKSIKSRKYLRDHIMVFEV